MRENAYTGRVLTVVGKLVEKDLSEAYLYGYFHCAIDQKVANLYELL